MAQGIITIVSGLPRSGTSLMMQMLEAGGLPAMTDGNRLQAIQRAPPFEANAGLGCDAA